METAGSLDLAGQYDWLSEPGLVRDVNSKTGGEKLRKVLDDYLYTHVHTYAHVPAHMCPHTEKEACRVEVLWKHLGSSVPAAVRPGSQFCSIQTVSLDSLHLLFMENLSSTCLGRILPVLFRAFLSFVLHTHGPSPFLHEAFPALCALCVCHVLWCANGSLSPKALRVSVFLCLALFNHHLTKGS